MFYWIKLAINKLLLTISCFLIINAHLSAWAICGKGEYWHDRGSNSNQGSFSIPSIILTNNQLQPPGVSLASNTIDAVAAFPDAQADNVIYWCNSESESKQMQIVFAVNGSDWGSGQIEAPTMPKVFYTHFARVGFRITLAQTGQIATRTYQLLPIRPIYNESRRRWEFRMGQLSPITIELFKVSNDIKNKLIYQGPYTASSPLMFYAFNIPGSPINEAGSDSAKQRNGWPMNFISYGISYRPATNLSAKASCIVQVNTPIINFAVVSVQELNDGNARSSNVALTFSCDSQVMSQPAGYGGISPVVFGFKIPNATLQQSENLHLVNNSGGLTYLISNGYNGQSIARGVGVRLINNLTGKNINFIGLVNSCGQSITELCHDNTFINGNYSGWYSVKDGANLSSYNEKESTVQYQQNFTAYFEKIPSLTVTPGKYHSVAEVLIRMQ